MSATVLPWPARSVKRQLGPVPAVITASRVVRGERGPLLEMRVVLRLNDIPRGQRQALAGLLRSGDLLHLTLKSVEGGEGGPGG